MEFFLSTPHIIEKTQFVIVKRLIKTLTVNVTVKSLSFTTEDKKVVSHLLIMVFLEFLKADIYSYSAVNNALVLELHMYNCAEISCI